MVTSQECNLSLDFMKRGAKWIIIKYLLIQPNYNRKYWIISLQKNLIKWLFKDNNQCKMAIIHGMSIASMLTCRCEQFYINFKKEKYEDDSRPQCCIDHDKYFSTCDTCEFGE